MSSDIARDRWELPTAVLAASVAEMAVDGSQNREGIALWLGRREDDLARVTHVVVLRGPGVVREPDYIEIGPDLFNEVTDAAMRCASLLVGQIHSHGHGWGTNLSPIDRRGGLHVPGFLSIVAPDYGLKPDTTIADCGVHVYERGAGYRRLRAQEVGRRVVMVSGTVEVLEVGR